MKYLISSIMIVWFLGCGADKSESPQTLGESSLVLDEDKAQIEEEKLQETTSKKLAQKTATIYLHGFSKSGYKSTAVYGRDSHDKELQEMVETTGFDSTESYDKNTFTNIIAATPYYGSTPPNYYTAQDISDIENSPLGIPRYALIVAKFAKHILEETGADKVNLLSVSMGSLVSRYLIEKDLENLASQKKIDKWLSLEGVIKGNIAASDERLLDIVNEFEEQSIDVEHMRYSWINTHLNPENPNYHDIRIGFESSTRDNVSNSALSFWLRLNGGFEANDGVQVVKDTFFEGDFTHAFYHDNHYSLADNKSAWGFAKIFLTSNKRVRITLLEATLQDLHEDDLPFKDIKPAEIVFQSDVHISGFSRAIDERVLGGGYLRVHHYHDSHVTKTLNQELFDSYLAEDKTMLTLSITPYELDMEPDYGVRELTGHGDHESLGKKTIALPLREGIYPLQSNQWSGSVKVEVLD